MYFPSTTLRLSHIYSFIRSFIYSFILQPLDQTFVTNTANPRAALEATLSGVYSTLQLGGTIMARVGDERYELFVTEYVSPNLSPFIIINMY